ncbi:MAG: hypothetical protein H6742_01990 [Alphaproteobacteria bacterium]|nr:hypothetical protein [Alphaproteobacteria bacterium]
MRLTPTGLVIALLLATGCKGGKDGPTFGTDGSDAGVVDDSGGDDTAGPTDSGGDTDTDTDTDGGADSGSTEVSEFSEPGDVTFFEDDDGKAVVDLTDVDGDSNQDQEFYLLLVSENSAGLGYQLRYDTAGSSGPPAPAAVPSSPARPQPKLSPFRQHLRDQLATGEREIVSRPAPPPLGIADVGVAKQEFRVRDSLTNEQSYSISSATLWGVGDTVAIWVDDGVPIDWDFECDGVVDVSHPYEAYGFDNCDLQVIADIVDTNIVPNMRDVFGFESDVNEDGLLSVVITPELNVISYTSDDEDVQGSIVGSYADPEVDLTDWDAVDNPGSNEQEVIYVFAPDPYGFFNPAATATVDEYTSMELASQIARSYFSLISYNQHVIVGGGAAEESWVNQGFGALAADLVGFGAAFYDDAWDYLDATHLEGLSSSEDGGALGTTKFGPQYLFARWIYDAYGVDAVSDLVQTGGSDTGGAGPLTGIDNFEAVLGEDFNRLVTKWQLAILLTDATDDSGGMLVTDIHTFPPYAGATTLTAPVEDPSSGDFYGANGYQSGIEIRGVNRYMEGGVTDRPVENAVNRVRLSGHDHTTYVSGIEFWGYNEGAYSASLVRLTDIPYDAAQIEIESGDTGYFGAVIRWNDPDPATPDTVIERIFSPTKADNIELPLVPTDSSVIYGVGEITESGYTNLVEDGDTTEATVVDTDRWLLDLGNFASGEDVTVAVQFVRHYASESGDAAPFDPWLAVVPTTWVPTPTVEGTRRGSCTEGDDFQYPTSMLPYLYSQVFLSGKSGITTADSEDEEIIVSVDCGTITGDTSCGEDWDRDGVLDIDEPTPTNFLGQVHVMQCTLNANDPTLFDAALAEGVFDIDSLDEDDTSYFDRANDLGGMADDSGEEAMIVKHLEGGEKYLIVVGAETYTGPYELVVRALD